MLIWPCCILLPATNDWLTIEPPHWTTSQVKGSGSLPVLFPLRLTPRNSLPSILDLLRLSVSSIHLW
ncbi:hypothetical protein LDENG_00163060 [Lucifuga dentata]|nr:hypothetical protein LDENG_00163060 [Lucifuga dentata]